METIMSLDPVVQCFADEFERFHTYLLQQIEMCPQELWQSKNGGYYFWQEQVHVFYCVQLYALPEGQEEECFGMEKKALMLKEEAPSPLSKQEVLEIAGKMKAMANVFLGRMTQADFMRPNPALTRYAGKERPNVAALIAMVRHYSYHIGSCDAMLRSHGLPGIY